MPVITQVFFSLDEETITQAEKEYGSEATHRLHAWEKLIQGNDLATDLEKLHSINDFFNQLQFIDDSIHWQEADYWATPLEFLASGGGDCEDFSIAKYFTLKAIGVPDNKLNITYVKALRLNQAHMVLTYHETPGSEPLVLDNLIPEIVPAGQRTDLLPVYSFNASGLWLAKTRGQGKLIGKSDRLKRWQELMQRMPNGIN